MAVEEIHAEMVSSVWKVLVEPGARVAVGDTLVILESMKMEIPVITETGGTVTELKVVEAGGAATTGAASAARRPAPARIVRMRVLLSRGQGHPK